MLIRNVKLYDPDNAIFQVPLEKLRQVVNTLVAAEGSSTCRWPATPST